MGLCRFYLCALCAVHSWACSHIGLSEKLGLKLRIVVLVHGSAGAEKGAQARVGYGCNGIGGSQHLLFIVGDITIDSLSLDSAHIPSSKGKRALASIDLILDVHLSHNRCRYSSA